MHSDPRFETLVAEGLAASGHGRTEDALRLFGEAAAVEPDSGVPHFLIGSEHASCGNIDAAERAFANAVLLAPEFLLARYQLGLLQFSSARAAVALLTWDRLLELPPEHPLPHFVHGFAALARDEFPQALAHFRDGLARPEDNPAVFADIRQVVQGVEALVANRSATPQPQPHPETPPEAQEEPAAGHVLLSAYGRNLH